MEVILSNFKDHPSCPHGPCLLFERYSANGIKTGRKFYACSACRDRSECNFFHWADEAMSENTKMLWEKIKLEKKPPFPHDKFFKRLELFMEIPVEQRVYCKTCSLLILDDSDKHSNHNVICAVTNEDLLHPSSLFEVYKNKKVEAQNFFSESTVSFIVSLLKGLGFTKLVCIGAPRIHEHIIHQKIKEMTSLLLDIDYRYMQFFSPKQFCHYNMFNNYLFDGDTRKQYFKAFLKEGKGEKVAVILDPPFGGLIDAISFSVKAINTWWQEKNNNLDKQVPILWVFPYFHEHRILKNLPDMKMMDYKVEYENHEKFGKNSSKKSPVRIFTNIKASSFILPKKDGYKYCNKCKRYVSAENKHCSKCNSCTTKHGKTYHHCEQCNQCVKSSYVHCKTCNKCGLASETSNICKYCKCNSTGSNQDGLERCFKCHGVGHRKRTCPEVIMRHSKRRKFKKNM